MRVVGIIAVLLLFSVSFGFGAYETPKTTSGCRIEPYALVVRGMFDSDVGTCLTGHRFLDR